MAIYSRYKLKTGEEVDYFPPIQNTDNPYLTEAAMYADQANQLEGYGYLVANVGAFTYLGTVAGTAADYEGFGGGGVQSDWDEIDSNKASFILNKPVDSGQLPFIAKWNVIANDTITLPIGAIGVNNVTVNWGDGTIDKEYNHTYISTGEKTISIYGRLEDFRFLENTNISKDKLIEIVSWGDIEWKNINFSGCVNLTLIGNDIPNFINCTSLKGLFSDTGITTAKTVTFTNVQHVTIGSWLFLNSELNYIEPGMMNNFVNLVEADSFFENTKITELPALLLANSPQLVRLSRFCIDTVTLIAVPEDIFIGAIALRNLQLAFTNTGISTVPKKLLWFSPNITNVERLFLGCPVTYLDAEFFKYCKKIIVFREFFNGINTYSGIVPPIWMDFPDVISTFSSLAFNVDVNNNIDEVPVDWGGNNTDWANNKGTVNKVWTGSQYAFDNVLPQAWKDDPTVLKFII